MKKLNSASVLKSANKRNLSKKKADTLVDQMKIELEKKIDGAPPIVQKTLEELKIKKEKTIECKKSNDEVVNFNDAKPDLDANRIVMDKGAARYIFDIWDLMLGKTFEEESKKSFAKYSKDGNTIDNSEADNQNDQAADTNKTSAPVTDPAPAKDGAAATTTTPVPEIKGQLNKILNDFGLQASMNPETLLKIYAKPGESSLAKDNYTYFVIQQIYRSANKECDTPELFCQSLKNIKLIYNFLNCKNQSHISASDFKDGFRRLIINFKCKGQDAEFRPSSKSFNLFVTVAQELKTRQMDLNFFAKAVLQGLNERYNRADSSNRAAGVEERACLIAEGQGPQLPPYPI